MLDINEQKHNFYMKKFQSLDLKIFALNNTGYDFSCFKVKIDDILLNLIFVNPLFNDDNINSILECVNHFDFNLSKIFYSFQLDSIFMSGSLFRSMIRMENCKNNISQYSTTSLKDVTIFYILNNIGINSYR